MKLKSLFSLEIKSSSLILFLTMYFAFFLNIRFWKFVIDEVSFTNLNTGVFVFSLLFFIACPFFILFNLLVIKKIAKPVIVLLLCISSGVQYMMLVYGVYIDRFMIQNVLETNTREALDMLTFSFIFWFLVSGVVPAILLSFAHIRYQPFKIELKTRIRNIIIAILILVIFAGTSYKEYASYGRNHHAVPHLINTLNYISSTIKYYKKRAKNNRLFKIIDENAKWSDFINNEKTKSNYTVLVIILGETARAKSFSLQGYERETNPLLSKQDIIYFKNMHSCGTATAVSVPCMFSSMTREDFDGSEAEFTENLLDLAAKSGYDIYWKENDNGCKGVCNRVKKMEDMIKTNNPQFCNGSYCYDGVLLESLKEIMPTIKQNTLIILHTIGSHGPAYYERYPAEFKIFTPTCDIKDIQNCTKEAIINTYDNTIVYTDYIISLAINILKQYPQYESGLIYISDHGESLGEHQVYLHGIPYKIAPSEQTEIPAVLWMSDTMKKLDFINYECMKYEAQNNVYSQDNLFHSVLGLLEIDSKTYQKEMDWFSNCRTEDLPHNK